MLFAAFIILFEMFFCQFCHLGEDVGFQDFCDWFRDIVARIQCLHDYSSSCPSFIPSEIFFIPNSIAPQPLIKLSHPVNNISGFNSTHSHGHCCLNMSLYTFQTPTWVSLLPRVPS